MSVKFACRHQYKDGFMVNAAFEAEGRCTVLFGPSGSGKTSVLSMIAGVLNPRKGAIEVNDDVVLDTSKGICVKPEHRGVGYVFQDPNLFPHLTVAQNLEFGCKWRRPQSKSIDLKRIIEVLEIEHLLQRHPGGLSGGEKQRVAMGRALASGPRLLLMDEPVAHLDSELRIKVLDYLQRSLHEWDVPVIYVTHSREEANLLADSVKFMNDGRMVIAEADADRAQSTNVTVNDF